MNVERPLPDARSDKLGEQWNRAAKEKTKSRVAAWRMIVLGLFGLAALVSIVVKFAMSGPVTPEAAGPAREIRQMTIEGLAPVGRIPRSEIGNKVPVRFRWQRLESASYYFVRVFGPAGEPLDSGQVTSPPYEVREAKRGLFFATGAFSWEVTAYTADAKQLGKSPRVEFTVE